MRNLTGLILVVSLLTSGLLNAGGHEKKTAGLGLFSVHEMTLKPGVSNSDFEKFILNEWIPPYNELKGMHVYLTQGDRGVRVKPADYALVIVWASVEDRDRVYPPSGQTSAEIANIHQQKGSSEKWEKFSSMATGVGETFTDYVVLSK